MKKILSLGIASAVLAMTALSASAAVVVRSDDTVTNGATIKVDFVLDGDASALSFKTTASGLTLVDASIPGAGALDVVSTDKTGMVSLTGRKSGDVVFTQTYTVTAKEGEAVSVNVTDLEGTTGITPLTKSVVASGTTSTPTSEPTSTPTSEPTSEPTSTPTSEPTSTPTSEPTSSTPSGTENPPTGVALAIFPAVIAGAAVVVAKKKRG